MTAKRLKRYYQVVCLKCKGPFRYDQIKPGPCPTCGYHVAVYKGYNVVCRAAIAAAKEK